MIYLSWQYLSFKEFVEKYRLKNGATSNVKERNPRHTQIKLNRNIHER